MDLGVAEQALAFFTELRIRRYPMSLLLERVWFLRETLSAQDAAYIALAEALDVPLPTTDKRLARGSGHRARILAPS